MKNKTVGEIVAMNINNAKIFKKYKIDFCCGGNTPLETACEKKNISVDTIIDEINNLTNNSHDIADDFSQMELDALAEYIVEKHHTYVMEHLPIVEEYVNKIARVHGDTHAELYEVQKYFITIRDELLSHMPKEENVLFPYIKTLIEAKKSGIKPVKPHFGTIKNPIRVMESEHDNAGDAFEKIHKITQDYTLPADACKSYQFAFHLLEEFENDLNIHIHLENNILFPRAIALEEEIFGK